MTDVAHRVRILASQTEIGRGRLGTLNKEPHCLDLPQAVKVAAGRSGRAGQGGTGTVVLAIHADHAPGW